MYGRLVQELSVCTVELWSLYIRGDYPLILGRCWAKSNCTSWSPASYPQLKGITRYTFRMAASLSVLLLVCLSIVNGVKGHYNLTLMHTNDVHARFLQTDKYSAKCPPAKAAAGKCFGGIARRVTKVRGIRASDPNVLLVDAGDQYQGTLWFYVHRGAAAAHFMNRIRYDAMVSTD